MDDHVLLEAYKYRTSHYLNGTGDVTAIHLGERVVAHLTQPAAATARAAAATAATELREILWDAIHAVAFKGVHPGFRDAYAWATLVQCAMDPSTYATAASVDLAILLGTGFYRDLLLQTLLATTTAT